MADKPKPNRFTTPPFVLSYPNLWKARKNKFNPNGDPRFSATAIWTPGEFGEKDKKQWSDIRQEVAKQLRELFKVEGKNLAECEAALLKKYPKASFAFRKGTEAAFAEKPGYGEGKIFASLSTTSPPGVVDLSKATIHPSEGNSDEIYPGCVCRATITPVAYKHESGGVGYAFYLGNVQKIKDGARLDNRVAAEDDFNDEIDEAWVDADADAATDEGEAFE
jgi:ssDNA-binding protein